MLFTITIAVRTMAFGYTINNLQAHNKYTIQITLEFLEVTEI